MADDQGVMNRAAPAPGVDDPSDLPTRPEELPRDGEKLLSTRNLVGALRGELERQACENRRTREELEARERELRRTRDELVNVREAAATATLAQARLHSIFGAVGDAIICTDADGIVSDWNAAAERIFGYAAQEVIGRPAELLVPSERREEILGCFRQLRRGERVAPFETVRVRKSGRRIDVWVRLATVHDAQGHIIGVSAIVRDITERKRAERALRESEELKSRMLASSRDCIEVVDLDGRLVFVNRAGRQLRGLKLQELRRWSWLELWSWVDREGASVAMRTARAGHPASFVGQTTGDGGGARWWDVSIAPMFDESGLPERFLVTSRDVTEREETERELRKHRELLRIVTHTGPALIAYVDADGVYRLVNPEHARWLGRANEELVGASAKEMLAEAAGQGVVRRLEDALRRGTQASFEVKVRPEPNELWLQVELAPHRNAAGEVVGVVMLAHDVSDQKIITHALADASRRKDEFLATLGHELRNPLAAMVSGLQVLQSDRPVDTQMVHGLMDKQLRRLIRLVDDLLDVARISRGKIQLKTERVDLVRIVRDTVDNFQLVQGPTRDLRMTVACGSAPVVVDPSRLQQVLENLLSNALRHTGESGRIEIEVRRNGDQVVVAVHDEGDGIDHEVLPHVFELFYQSDGTSNGGLGIGLTTVKWLVEMHGGTVAATSPGRGRGSTFTVRLPCDVEPPVIEDELVPVSLDIPPRRILLVEDNEDSAELMRILLVGWGQEVHVAGDGRTAIERALEIDPHLVFLDLGLPDCDGCEVARALRATPALAHTRIVALSGFGRTEDRARALEAGCIQHLTKPASPEELVALVRHLDPS